MKKILVFSLLIFSLLVAYSQALHIFEKGKDKPAILLHEEIDSITTLFNDSITQQLFHTNDSIYTYNTSDVDRIVFNLSFIDPKYKEINLPKYEFVEFMIQVNHGIDNWELTSDDVDWFNGPDFGYGSSEISAFRCYTINGDTDKDRTMYIYFISDHGTDTLKVTQLNKVLFDDNKYHGLFNSNHQIFTTHTWQKRVYQMTVNEPFLFSSIYFWYETPNWINYSISEDKRTLTLEVDENKLDTTRSTIFSLRFEPGGISVMNHHITLCQHKAGVATLEMQKDALIDLYNSMGGRIGKTT